MALVYTLTGQGDAVPLEEMRALRERNFGDHELQSCSNYEAVWAADAQSTATRWGSRRARQRCSPPTLRHPCLPAGPPSGGRGV
jgi:hypothetical protein